MMVMCAQVEYVLSPTKVPCVCQEHFYSVEELGAGKLSRKFLRLVSPGVWFGLRKIFQ